MHSATISLKPCLASTIAQRVLRRLASTLSGAYDAWMHQRQARATVYALGLLDERTLHDLALDRSELRSAAAELHGQAQRERRHAWLGAEMPR